MAFTFKPLPELRGTEREQLQTIHRYLFAFANELNTALNRIDTLATSANTAVQAVATPGVVGVVGGVIDEKVKSSYGAIRSLIIKTADTVYASMDEIRQTLVTDYVAQSEFGTFQQSLVNTITETAQGLLLDLDYDSRLDAVDESMAGFSSYQAKTDQYIKIGVVGEDENGIPISGVAVGNNLTETIVDGVTHIISQNMYSCFTADQLSFWKDGIRQAYFSNETLYVTHANITNDITVGGNWRIDATNGYSIKWVG